MRKTLIATLVGAGLLAVAVLPAASGARKTRTVHISSQVTGAGISATQSAFKIHDAMMGDGAGVQTVKASGLAGTDTEIIYYGNATATSKGNFTLGVPNAQGISTVTGSGRDIGGTGKLKGFKSNYTYSGKFNTKTMIYNVTITGTGTLP